MIPLLLLLSLLPLVASRMHFIRQDGSVFVERPDSQLLLYSSLRFQGGMERNPKCSNGRLWFWLTSDSYKSTIYINKKTRRKRICEFHNFDGKTMDPRLQSIVLSTAARPQLLHSVPISVNVRPRIGGGLEGCRPRSHSFVSNEIGDKYSKLTVGRYKSEFVVRDSCSKGLPHLAQMNALKELKIVGPCCPG
jgi:hypothetical protein